MYGIHIPFSEYINPSTEQQRVNLAPKMAETDTQEAVEALWHIAAK